MGGEIGVERRAGIENFLKVFQCQPAEQAKTQLEQLLSSSSSPADRGKKEYQTPELKEIPEEKVREAAGELNRALVRQAEEAMGKVREIAGEKRAVAKRAAELEKEVEEYKEANAELARALKKAEKELLSYKGKKK